MIMRVLLLVILAAGAAFSQPVGGGIKAGVPFTDFLHTAENGQLRYLTNTNRYIVGVFGELRFPFGLGVEVDALYRHLNYSGTGPSTSLTTTANAWEFPLLLKYRFKAPIARPFVTAGVAWDTLQGLKESILSGTVVNSSNNATALRHNTVSGFVMGAGLDVHALFLHVQPEVRYTRWGDKHFLDPSGLLKSNQNQAEFLLGISF